jgi:hypothetical protein
VGVGRAGRISLGLAGAIVLALALAQVFLPRIAASMISSRVGRYGKVESVSVHAWPAVELLWGKAGSVSVRAKSLRASPAQTAKLLWEARGAHSLDVTAESAQENKLQLTDVSLMKRGDALSAEAQMSQAAVTAALPEGIGLRLVKSEGGDVNVDASGGLFGVQASVEAVAGASEGKLVAHPLGFLLEGFQLTLFANPHVYVEGIGASVVSGPAGTPGYRITMTARLR